MEEGYADSNTMGEIEDLRLIPDMGTHLISLAVEEKVCIFLSVEFNMNKHV